MLSWRIDVRISDYALAPDGGTQIVTLEIDDGRRLSIGLDGRMDSSAAGMQLFIGNGPDVPGARMLRSGGAEEAEVITVLERWLEETQGLIRRKALMDADISALEGQDLLDRLALGFLLEIQPRHIDSTQYELRPRCPVEPDVHEVLLKKFGPYRPRTVELADSFTVHIRTT